jgi:hypothetical protein
MPNQKFTEEEFLNALDLVLDYLSETKEKANLKKNYFSKRHTIDLSGKLSASMQRVLAMYYRLYYGLEINSTDLSQMKTDLLAKIDYEALKKYRGIGVLGISKLQEIIELSLLQQKQ